MVFDSCGYLFILEDYRASTSLGFLEGEKSRASELVRGLVLRGEAGLVLLAGTKGGGALSAAVGGVRFRIPLCMAPEGLSLG